MRFIAAIVAAALLSMRPGASADIAHFLAELAKRRPVQSLVSINEAKETAERLRAFMYPKQRAFFGSKAKCKATSKTRRAGATAGGVRELLARSIETKAHRSMYMATTRQEARDRAWVNDTQSGFLDVLRTEGEPIDHPTLEAWKLGGIVVEVRDAETALNFSNGSQIKLFGMDSERDLRKERGKAKDVYWIDEAQDFPNLQKFYDAVIIGSTADFQGETWLSGTPGQDCAGFFYEITKNEEDGDQRIPGWEVHTIAVVDNPYFGRVTSDTTAGEYHVEYTIKDATVRVATYSTHAEAEAEAVRVRWDRTAGDAMRKKGWKGDEPDFIREWLGRWVKTDARYVYPVHAVPKHVLVYAPQRLADNPIDATHAKWYHHELAVLDLPRKPRGRMYEWLYAIGADFGYAQTPFALTMWAFNFEMPDIFEMLSWKQHKVLPDDQRKYIELLWGCTNNVIAMAGDPAGQKSADLEAWRTRFSLPIDDADKSAKNTWQELMAGDIRMGRVHYREGSPLLHEHRHLVYLPTKPGKTRKDDEFRRIADGTVPGNDCADAGLYAYRFMQHHLHRDKPKDEREEHVKQADAHEEHIDQAEALREALIESGEADPYEDGYSWRDQ